MENFSRNNFRAETFDNFHRIMSTRKKSNTPKVINPRNIAGQVFHLLCSLPMDCQQKLIFQFIDHVVYAPDLLWEFPVHLKRLYDALQSYCEGKTGPDTIEKYLHEAYDISGYTADIEYLPDGGSCQESFLISPHFPFRVQKVHELIYLLDDWCRKEEYRITGHLRYVYCKHLHAPDISRQACYVRAVSLEGDDWNCDDIQKRNEVRKRGQEASQKEAQWQLSMIKMQYPSSDSNGVLGQLRQKSP